MKTMLVVGSAPCLYEDVANALKLRPFASLMLINGACTAIEYAEHVLAGHEEKAEFFAAARSRKFPNAPPWRLHACTMPHRLKLMKEVSPSVTDWHPHESGTGATSASKGAKIAFLLGFDQVVLCGCPMDGGGYFPGEGTGIPQSRNCLRVGESGVAVGFVTPDHRGQYTTRPGEPMLVQEAKIIRMYRERLKELARGEFKDRVFSMSGFTREQLGEPKEF